MTLPTVKLQPFVSLKRDSPVELAEAADYLRTALLAWGHAGLSVYEDERDEAVPFALSAVSGLGFPVQARVVRMSGNTGRFRGLEAWDARDDIPEDVDQARLKRYLADREAALRSGTLWSIGPRPGAAVAA